MLLAEVAVPIPLAHAFTYEVPAELVGRAVPGARVLCDFGKRQVMAIVLGLSEREPDPDMKLKKLRAVVESRPVVPAELLDFLKVLASYYFAPIGAVLRLALPALEKKSVEALEAQGELLTPSALAGTKRSRSARELVVTPTTKVESPGSLRGQARELLVHVRSHGGGALSRLEERFSNARAAAKKLEGLGLVVIEQRDKEVVDPFDGDVPRDAPPELTPDQATAVARITQSLGRDDAAKAFLLFGVTGAGKTEVYLHAIAECLARGRGAVMMVPEIALTPQLVSRFRARFGDDLAVVHSALGERARREMQRRLHSGEVKVAIGARSALFAPVPALGLVIVDEEHDGSFKQEEGVRYHARDMALLRAHRAKATAVLGSATPSLESFELARRGKLEMLRLPGRASSARLPDVTVVDLKNVGAGPSAEPKISLPLHRALEQTLSRGEQAIIFLNRRGHSPTIVCGSCGQVATCKACSVSLTFHRRRRDGDAFVGLVKCHYCGYQGDRPDHCEECNGRELMFEGLGTEKLEDTLARAFPTARIARLDRDVADGGKSAKILERMRRGEIDILVGTQMVTKGHDYPQVTLVGVINADSAMNLPDFRAAERAFQLLVQVAGRAGRHERPGRVLIQTYAPDHPAVRFAKTHDVETFVERELRDRAEAHYPPFHRLALARVDAIDVKVAEDAARWLASAARATPPARRGEVEVLGPAVAPLARLRGRYRFRVMFRAKERLALRVVLAAVESALADLDRRARASIDVDPVGML